MAWDGRRLRGLLPLVAIAGLGFWVRYELWLVFGGLERSYVAWATKHYFGGITNVYIIGARSLRAGHGFHVLNVPPGYSAVLAAWKLFGVGAYQHIRLAQAALDSLTVIPIAYVITRLTGKRLLGWLGALVYALAPRWAAGSVMLLAESLSPMIVCWVLAAIVWACDAENIRRWLVPAAAVGVSALIRPDLSLLIAPLAAFAAVNVGSGRRLVAVAAVTACVAVPVLGYGLYQQFASGEFVVLSTSGSYGLWSGLGQRPNKFGYYANDQRAGDTLIREGVVDKTWLGTDAKAVAFRERHPEGYVAIDRHWRREYARAWRQHPAFVLGTIGRRLTRIPFAADERFLPPVYGRTVTRYLRDLGPIALCAGVAILLYRRKYGSAALVSLPLVYAMASIGLVYFEDRYVRYMAVGSLFGAAVALGAMADALRRRIRLPPRFVLSAPAMIVVVAGLVAVGTVRPLSAKTRDARMITRAREALAMGTLPQRADVSTFVWQPISATPVARAGQGVSVVTSSDPGAYQITSDLHVAGSGAVVLAYAVDIHEGGMSIGVLDARKQHFLAQEAVTGPGEHRGMIAFAAGKRTTVSVVLSNFRTQPGVSTFDVTRLDEYFLRSSHS